MKKIFFSLLAIAAIASCAKTEPVYVEDNSEIKLAPVTTHVTKANVLSAIDGTEYPTAENFDVYAYWNTDDAGSTFKEGTLYLGGGDTPKAVEFTNKGAYWGGVTTYYWPKNGSLRFAAYSPSHLDFNHKLDGDVYSVSEYNQPSVTNATWDLLVAPTSVSYNAMTAAENVAVKFQHGLSWITLQVKAKDAEAAKAFDVKKITINDVVTKAALEAIMNNEAAKTVWKWDLTNTKAPYVVYEGSQAVTETATVIETTTAGTLVIPQETTSVTVEYTQNALEGTPALEGQSVTVDLVLDTDNTPWEPGKHYIYTLIFGLDEILINPSVVDWEDVEVGEIDTDKTVNNVATPNQFLAAIAEGGKVVLQDNVTLPDSTDFVAVENAVVLDLNGKTLTYTGDNRIFKVQNGGTLTINGDVEESAIVVNSDNLTASTTAAYLATVYENSVLIVNGGKYETNGCTVFHANMGKVVINCGDINATETGYDPAGKYGYKYTLNVQGDTGEIVVAGGTFHNYNPAYSEGENPVANFVKEGYAVVNDGTTYTVVPADEYVETLASGDVTLYTDLAVNEAVIATGTLNLNLNGKTLSVNEAIYESGKASALVTASTGSTVTIDGNGVVDASGYGDYAAEVRGGNLTIKNGTFIGEATAVYAVSGTVTIEGGYFEVADSSYGTTYLLNLSDANGRNGTAKIIVKGGTFKGFDPANNKAENPAVSFVADGYKSVDNGDGTFSVVAE